MVQRTRSVTADVLHRVRTDPYAMLGQASLACLRVFLDGYEWGCARAGGFCDLDPRLGRFSEWVAEKLGRGTLTVDGCWMIQLESADEARALERFFELWDEYSTFVEPEFSEDSEPTPPLPQMDFRQFLAAVRRRPALYLVQPSVTLLRALLQGYVYALENAGQTMEEIPDFDGFSRWLCAHHGLKQQFRWDRVLLLFHPSEAEACEQFFRLLPQFDNRFDAAS